MPWLEDTMRRRRWTWVFMVIILLIGIFIISLSYSSSNQDTIISLDPLVLTVKGGLPEPFPVGANLPVDVSQADALDGLYQLENSESGEYSYPTLAQRLDRRKYILRRACEVIKDRALPPPYINVYRQEPDKHLMISNEKQVLYCFLPKVANTNFRRVFLGLQGVVPKPEVPNISGYDIYFTYDKKFKYLSGLSQELKQNILERYRKFVVVRDPLERLLSGYRNKFFHPNENHKAEYHNNAVVFYAKHPKARQEHNMRMSFKDKEMTFEEFLTYWTDVFDANEFLNEHFVPSYLLCNPCGINFDFIGKYETINTEVKYIFDQLKIDIDFPGRNDNYSSMPTYALIEQYYKPIPDKLLQKTWNILKFDYVLFGYRLPDWFYEKVRKS